MQGNSVSPSVRLNKKSRVEVISLGRGEEKNLLVWLYPAGASDELKAARLQRRSFRISLKCAEKKGYTKQRFSKIIQVGILHSASCACMVSKPSARFTLPLSDNVWLLCWYQITLGHDLSSF